jgi:methyltransferase (TIGR00027 family)
MYRAQETERPDAHFRDPYARLLAGERGEEILRRMPGATMSAWPMVVRTCVFDELILRCVEREGVDTVLNLASGLDTRPYRLPLPADLRWFEADLPEILSYKDGNLSQERPRCQRESVPTDLSDIIARKALFARVASASRKAVVVSEGFLVYLAEKEVASLARDLHEHPAFRWWIIDLASPLLLKRLKRAFREAMTDARARMQFAPEAGTEFFREFGWNEAEFRSTWEDARRLRREMPMAWLFRLLARLASAQRREVFRRMGASVLLERASSAPS